MKGTHHLIALKQNKQRKARKMGNQESFVCPICGNSDMRYIGTRKGKAYCRKCITFRGQEPTRDYIQNNDSEYTLSYELSEDQKRLSRQLVENYINGIDSLVHAVTGAGKTEIILNVISYAIYCGQKVGFVVPRRDVIKELYLRFKSIFINNKIVAVYGGHTSILEADLVCLTSHQLFRYEKYFDLLILDEIDAFPYNGNDVLEAFFKRAVRGHYIMMSATPSKELVEQFKSESKKILKLNTRFHGHPLPVPTIQISRGIMQYYHLVRVLRGFYAQNKPVFIFTPTIDVCEQTYNVLRLLFKNAQFVHSKCEDRSERIEAFRKGQLKALVTTAVLERGVTVKNLQVIVFKSDHAIYTSQALIQISGRAGRKKDAPDGEVIFIGSKKTKEMVECIDEIESANESLQTMLRKH